MPLSRALRMLSESNQALIRITDEGELLRDVCRIVVEVGGYRLAWVGFAEHDEARTVRPVASAGGDFAYPESASVTWSDTERGQGPGGTAIRTGRPCVVRNILADPSFAPWREAAAARGFSSLIALPLKSGGRTLGALGIYSGEKDAFDPAEVAILSELAGDLAFGLTALRTRAKREQAEAALAAQHATLRGIIEGATSPIFSLDREYRFVAFNRSHAAAMKALNGVEIEVGRSMIDYLPEGREREEARGHFDRALSGEHFVKLVTMGNTPGPLTYLEVSHHPVLANDGSIIGVAVFANDVTERRRAELELLESEQKYRSLADSSPDNIVRYDANGRRMYVNRHAIETMGLDLSSRIGTTPAESGSFPGIENYYATLMKVVASGRPDELEVEVPNAAGELRTHNVRFVAERDKDGRIIGALAFGRDVTERKEAARERQRYLDQLRQNLEEAVAAIAATVEARDPYTAGHQRHVAALAAAIADEMGLRDEEVKGIHLAGTVHDVGKIKVPAEILARPGKLSEIEARLIQLHPEAGWEILKGVEFPWPIAKMVLEHHERLDGSGYPKRLTGGQISFGARVLAVADVVEAMATHRPYRPSRGMEFALCEIERARGVLYDATVVDACLRLFREKGYRFPD